MKHYLNFFQIGLLIGIPLGIELAFWLSDRKSARDIAKSQVGHVPKLGEYVLPFVVDESTSCRVLFRLLRFKLQLLGEQLLLKFVGESTGDPGTDKGADDGGSKGIKALCNHPEGTTPSGNGKQS